jgi:glycosyltransferase involved in cell wall biosynthesis
LKVALVHDWLTGMRGGEKCLEVLCELFPRATLFTLFRGKNPLSPAIAGMEIRTSFLDRLPFIHRYYRLCLPLFPAAIEHLDLKGYDLVISSSFCAAKGVVAMPDSLHICYCYSPMRYAWDMRREYFSNGFGPARALLPFFLSRLRAWDATASLRVDSFIAISRHVQDRIRKYYRRGSTVIHPPVDCQRFRPADPGAKSGDHYLMVTALAPYKRVDLAVEAFNRSGKPLRIVGSGPGLKRLRKQARGNIEFLGWRSDDELRDHYQACRALVFPGEEDFGIAPLEAQASGKPVIAYGRGGALETIIPLPAERPTGVLFPEPTVESLERAVATLEANAGRFDPAEIRKNALRFDRPIFKERLKEFIERKVAAGLAGDREDACAPQV